MNREQGDCAASIVLFCKARHVQPKYARKTVESLSAFGYHEEMDRRGLRACMESPNIIECQVSITSIGVAVAYAVGTVGSTIAQYRDDSLSCPVTSPSPPHALLLYMITLISNIGRTGS